MQIGKLLYCFDTVVSSLGSSYLVPC